MLYVKRKNGEPKEYYPIFIERKDKFNLTLKCDFFKIKHTRVTASEVALIVKPLLQPDHNINYVFSGYAIQSYATKFYFVFCSFFFKVRTDKGYEYRLKVLEKDRTFSDIFTRLVTKEEIGLDEAFAELVKLNKLMEKSKKFLTFIKNFI